MVTLHVNTHAKTKQLEEFNKSNETSYPFEQSDEPLHIVDQSNDRKSQMTLNPTLLLVAIGW